MAASGPASTVRVVVFWNPLLVAVTWYVPALVASHDVVEQLAPVPAPSGKMARLVAMPAAVLEDRRSR